MPIAEVPQHLHMSDSDLTCSHSKFMERMHERLEQCRAWSARAEELAPIAHRAAWDPAPDRSSEDARMARFNAQVADICSQHAREYLRNAERDVQVAAEARFHRNAVRMSMDISLYGAAAELRSVELALARIQS